MAATSATPPAGIVFALSLGARMNETMNRPPSAPTAAIGGGDLAGLLDSVASGDRGALSELYRRTSAKLYGICIRLLGSEAEAEDALQEAYVTVWRNAARFDAAKASPITWLAVVTRGFRRPTPVLELEE